MGLETRINGFRVVAQPDGRYTATCEHDAQTLVFTDLTSAYIILHNYDMCWESDSHPNLPFMNMGTLVRVQ